MSNPFLTNALRASESPSPASQLLAARPANGRASADASFSNALERRLEPGNRAPDRAEGRSGAPREGPRRSATDETHGANDRPLDGAGGVEAGADASAERAQAPDERLPSNEAASAASLAVPAPQLAGSAPQIAAADAPADEAVDDGPGKASRRRGAAAAGITAEALGRGAGARTARAGGGPDGAFEAKPSKPDVSQADGLAPSETLRAVSRTPAAQHGEHPAPFSALASGAQARGAEALEYAVRTPAGQRAWAEDVGSKVMWMVGRNESKAELVLTPPHLGKLEVSINMSGDQSSAHFVAASAAARDALEQAMPRLRELLQQAGINLGEANVSTSGEQTAHRDAPNARGAPGRLRGEAGPDTDAGGPAPSASAWTRTGRGIVDTFA